MDERWIELTVDGSTMRALVALPPQADGQAPGAGAAVAAPGAHRPGVVLCMHAPGIDDVMKDIASRLAAAGFATIVPDLYHRQDPANGDGPLQRMGRLRDDEFFRDLAAAAAALRMTGQVAPRGVSVVGFCMGGRIAFLQVARDASLNTAVCFYPGSIDAAWSDDPAALTPLQWGERIAVPVLGLFGAEDTNPGPAHMAAIGEVLRRGGVAHELRDYPGCGHAFLNFQRPTYREDAAQDAWARCVDWLRRHGMG